MSFPRIAVISVHYYDAYVERSVRQLERLCAALTPVVCVAVANSVPVLPLLQRVQADGGFIDSIVEHDNMGLEFGAYQAGLEQACESIEADWFVIVNDTFGVHECFTAPHRRNFERAVNARERSEAPIVVGAVDEMPRSFQLGGLRTHRWVRSNILALNDVAMRNLGYRLYRPELERLIVASGEIETFFASDLDGALRDRIQGWLFPDAATADWRWYKAAPLDAGNAMRLARKARSILQEKYLSARLEAVSTVFIDIKQMSLHDHLQRVVEKRLFDWRALRRRAQDAAA